jgi:hypothetical protein
MGIFLSLGSVQLPLMPEKRLQWPRITPEGKAQVDSKAEHTVEDVSISKSACNAANRASDGPESHF